MINRVYICNTIRVPERYELLKCFVNPEFVTIMNNYIHLAPENSRFRYRKELYECLREHVVEQKHIGVYVVSDPKCEGNFVFIEVGNLRMYDLPIECFTVSIGGLKETIKYFK